MKKISHRKSTFWPYPVMSKRQYRRWRGRIKVAEFRNDNGEEYDKLDQKWWEAVKDYEKRRISTV